MRAYGLILSTAALVASCTDDLEAPYNYQLGTTTGPDVLEVGCGEIPRAAVGATFTHMLEVTGGEGPFTYAATVPEGLVLDASTGEISGVPVTAGPAMFELTVTDSNGDVGMAACTFDIGERITIDLALDAVPYCLRGADTLLNHIVEGTGDGSPIVCDHTNASGNGKIPNGLSVNPDTCAIEGTRVDATGPSCTMLDADDDGQPDDPCSTGFGCLRGVCEPYLGTWAFVVRGTQSGAEVFIPYCVTNDTPAPGTYPIEMSHSGMADQTLEPFTRTFDPGAVVQAGAVDDPLITATDNGDCPGNACTFSFQFFINASPFELEDANGDGKPVVVDPQLGDDGTNDTLSHGLRLSTNAPVAEAFRTRAWVVNLDLMYCFSADAADCETEGPDADPQPNGLLEFSAIMVPSG